LLPDLFTMRASHRRLQPVMQMSTASAAFGIMYIGVSSLEPSSLSSSKDHFPDVGILINLNETKA
jgi:hypothetical protein